MESDNLLMYSYNIIGETSIQGHADEGKYRKDVEEPYGSRRGKREKENRW